MKIKASYPTQRPARIQYAAWLVAAMIVMMVVAQLFSYEDFPSALALVVPFNDQVLITIAAAKIVILEVFALPYLLGMRLSKLMRVVSALAAGVVSLFWFFMTLTSAHSLNSALFGTTITLPGGLAAASWTLVLAALCIYVILWSLRISTAQLEPKQ